MYQQIRDENKNVKSMYKFVNETKVNQYSFQYKSYSRLPMMIIVRSPCSPKSDGIPPDNAFVPMHQVINQVLKEINKMIDKNIVYK